VKFTPWQERHGASLASLHYRLGKLVEDRPGQSDRHDGSGRSHNTNDRCLEQIEPAPYVDMATVDRLEMIAAEGRIEMGEERWAKLNAEWSLSPEQRDQHEKEWQA
jgi:hypothetical protein